MQPWPLSQTLQIKIRQHKKGMKFHSGSALSGMFDKYFWQQQYETYNSNANGLVNPFPNKPLFLRVCSTSLENTVGKGEIARNEQFLLFPQCFLPVWRTFFHNHQIWNCRLLTLTIWKSLKFVVWERLKHLYIMYIVVQHVFTALTHYHKMPHFDALKIYSCGKHCEKRRNCW